MGGVSRWHMSKALSGQSRGWLAAVFGRETDQEVAQDLIPAILIVLVILGAEQGTELGLGEVEVGELEGAEHVLFLEVETDAQLAQDHVVVDPVRDHLGRCIFPHTAAGDDETVEELAQGRVGTGDIACLLLFTFRRLFHQPAVQLGVSDRQVALGKHLDHLVVADGEGVAQTAQNIIVGHADSCVNCATLPSGSPRVRKSGGRYSSGQAHQALPR
ncbi:hypothetical protein AERO8C_50068 [Aeromonas veronii]|uniref:Uncharacterized protein n=1 Tax=Aeromonas veronii TaxID=654 RepID=A0A653L8T8_AERVE|nr:hypothetical protein AERO8C_50068 [Aeromonas veronii]